VTLNASQQGAHLIKEIKANYPEKYVIAYTGSGNSPLFQEAFARSDLYLPKDARTDQWIETLDAAIEDLTNPMVVWKKYRLRLLEQGISNWGPRLDEGEVDKAFFPGFRGRLAIASGKSGSGIGLSTLFRLVKDISWRNDKSCPRQQVRYSHSQWPRLHLDAY
jgi:hypothetical protein